MDAHLSHNGTVPGLAARSASTAPGSETSPPCRGEARAGDAAPGFSDRNITHADSAVTQPALHRLLPASGQLLTVADIRGLWGPSGAVAGAGMFSVVWTTPDGRRFWAALHDFAPADQQRLIDGCRQLDRQAGCSGARSQGGGL